MKEFKVPMKFHTSSYRQMAAIRRKIDAKIKRKKIEVKKLQKELFDDKT